MLIEMDCILINMKFKLWYHKYTFERCSFRLSIDIKSSSFAFRKVKIQVYSCEAH